jgi:hypothetical protein
MESTLFVCLFAFLLLGSPFTLAQSPQTGMQGPSAETPVGRWMTIDDATGK